MEDSRITYPKIDSVEGLLEVLYTKLLPDEGSCHKGAGVMYCPKCIEDCRMHIQVLYFNNPFAQQLINQHYREDSIGIVGSREGVSPKAITEIGLSLFLYFCAHCDTCFVTLLFGSVTEPKLIILPSTSGGISTEHTPDNVRYYVDQAYQTILVEAYSASMAMFRSALEQILKDQKIKGKKLEDMIVSLRNSISGESKEPPPPWACQINEHELVLIQEVADTQVHANEIGKLTALDKDSMLAIQSVFVHLLKVIYEDPLEKAAKLEELQGILQFVTNPSVISQ